MLGIDLDPRRPVTGFSMATQQSIEIAKAISRKPEYVIFDEPSASLTEHETDRVLDQIRRMAAHGVGVIYISHRLDEVRAVAQKIVCLRDGNLVKTWDSGTVAKSDLVSGMVGPRVRVPASGTPSPLASEIVLSVRGLTRKGVFDEMNFDVARGEILGIAGLVGAGRTEVVRYIAGVDRADAGEVVWTARSSTLRSPADAIAAGIVMVPEDRKGQGLNLGRTSAENILTPWEKHFGRRRLITRAMLEKLADEAGNSSTSAGI